MKKRFSKMKLLTIIELSVLLIIGSYAWFSDKSNPSITQTNIKVTSAEGLMIKLTPDSQARTEVDLNQVLGDVTDFELKQMSTADGINFYTIDFGEGLSQENPKYVKISESADGYVDYKKWGFINFDFYLQTEDFAKHVYINKDTYISGLADKAIRVGLSFEKDGVQQVYIFGDTEENGIDMPFTTKAIVKEGTFDYNNVDPSFIGNQLVRTYASKNGGRGTTDDTEIDLTKVLLTIPAGSSVKINMKVWLEGGDTDCNNTLASTVANMLFKFGSANVLLDAPNVTANNAQRIINNLTTNMEYAFTNDATTIWTKVTDPNRVFARGNVVYVRIAEVPGVAPESYVTTVVFN